MVKKIKNKQGFIKSYIEYYLLDDTAKFSNNGKYLYVNDCWVHKNFRRNGILKYYIQKIIPQYNTAEYVYWNRGKYMKRMSVYKIERLNDKIVLKKEGR